MMTRVIVEIFVRIENFRNISTLVSILNPRQAKDGDCLLGKRYIGVILSCSILVRSSLPIVKKADLGLRSIATLHVPTS